MSEVESIKSFTDQELTVKQLLELKAELHNLPHITTLDFSKSKLELEGYRIIEEILLENHSLTSIIFPENDANHLVIKNQINRNLQYNTTYKNPPLTAKEKEIFQFLNQVIQESNCQSIVRVAGGWVRDKLLGKDSKDIDICVDNMSGVEFGQIIRDYIMKHSAQPKNNTNEKINISEVNNHENNSSVVPQDLASLSKRKSIEHAEELNPKKIRPSSPLNPNPKQNKNNNNNNNNKKKPQGNVKKLAVIKANPEMGKNVEVSTINLFNTSIDILSLRTTQSISFSKDIINKEQSQDKLQSTQEKRNLAAAEDAHLRDFTINSLYYNINTYSIEAFTSGFEDLKKGIIRCPPRWLSNSEQEEKSSELSEKNGTWDRLFEDPLRILRAIRFSCSLGFTITPAINTILFSNSTIRDKLANSISKERIQAELFRTLSGKNSLKALYYIAVLNLTPLIFSMLAPVKFEHIKMLAIASLYYKKEGYNVLGHENVEIALSLFFCSLYGSYTYANSSVHSLPFTREHMKEQWKYPQKESNAIVDYIEHTNEFITLSDQLLSSNGDNITQTIKSSGLLLRKTRERWIVCLSLAEIIEIVTSKLWKIQVYEEQLTRGDLQFHEFEKILNESVLMLEESDNRDIESILHKYKLYKEFLRDKGLMGFTHNNRTIFPIWEVKTLLSGKEIMTQFNISPGPTLGLILQDILEWQILNPSSDKQELLKVIDPILLKYRDAIKK